MLRSLENKVVYIGLLMMVMVGAFTYTAIRTYAVYRMSTELRLLDVRLQHHLHEHKADEVALRRELDEIEKTLYSPVLWPDSSIGKEPAKAAARRQSTMEASFVNSLNELRERVKRLEAFRYRTEQ